VQPVESHRIGLEAVNLAALPDQPARDEGVLADVGADVQDHHVLLKQSFYEPHRLRLVVAVLVDAAPIMSFSATRIFQSVAELGPHRNAVGERLGHLFHGQ